MFLAALELTQVQTGFGGRLIEKDYFCSLLLHHLSEECPELVFKGGTCLAKVHIGFYRLSEDLDFVVPTPTDAPRSQRSQRARHLKRVVSELPAFLKFFRVVEPLTGANHSTQYHAEIGYDSLLTGRSDTIQVEVALREPLALPPVRGAAQTILLHPATQRLALEALPVTCIAKSEAFAEKFRAALSRREVAVRDFFDLDFAARKLAFVRDDPELVALVRQKLAIPSHDKVDMNHRRLEELQRQLETELRPVLRTNDFMDFDLERAFRLVADMAAKMS
jgi:predicted nucleotidyltransferase component of viral defense system